MPLSGSFRELCPRCLLRLALSQSIERPIDESGHFLGAYELLERVGEGGMGVVWRAQQHRPVRRIVALKILERGYDSREVLSRFESERQALAILNHPNIATVLDAGVADDGRPYFVMEYVAGPPITAFADRHRLTIAARLELFLQVCHAVEHAHQKGLIHRDLKPTNILVAEVDERPLVKVIDFGVAKVLERPLTADTAETQFGVLLGTPEYMSPEQAGLSSGGVDTRTDIYSLGVVLYELLAGALPFDARALRHKAVLEMLRVIREEEPPRLTARITSQGDPAIGEIAARRLTEPGTLLRRLRGDLEWITARALEKEPARRYGSVSELGADVRRHLAHEPVIAAPPDLPYRLGKLARKHRGTAIAAGLASASLILGAVVSTFMWLSAERARRDNREHLKMLNVTTGLELAAAGDDLKALPWLVRALQLEEGGKKAEDLHRIRIHHLLEKRPYPVRIWYHEGAVDARLAPDRNSLATWDLHGTVRMWNTKTGELLGPFLTHDAGIADLQISGSSVITADKKGAIRVWDLRTGSQVSAAVPAAPGILILRVSKDGGKVLGADSAGNVRLWELSSGRLLAAIRLDSGVAAAEFLDAGVFAAADREGSVQLVDSATGRTIARLPHRAAVRSVVQLDVDRLATTTLGGAFQLWNIHTAKPLSEPTAPIPNGIDTVRLVANRTAAFLCGNDGAARVTVGSSGPSVRLGRTTNCAALDTSADGQLAAAGYLDGTLRIWLASGGPLGTNVPHPAPVILAGFLPESRFVLTVSADGLVRVWDLSPLATQMPIVRNYVFEATFSPDGRRIALAGGSTFDTAFGQGTLVDAVTHETLLPPLRHGGNVRGIAFSHDGRLVATTSDNGTARVWDVASGEPVLPELRHGCGVKEVVFSPDDTRLVTFGLPQPNCTTILWSLPDGKRITTLSSRTYTGSFSPDGQRLVTASFDGPRVEVWRANDGTPITGATWTSYHTAAFVSNTQVAMLGIDKVERRSLDDPTAVVSRPVPQAEGLWPAAGGQRLLVGTASGAIHVVNNDATLERRYAPLRLPGAVTAVGASADGRWLAGASYERRAQVWSLDTGEPVTPVREVTLLPLSVSFAPNGSRVTISGRDVSTLDLRPDSRPMDLLDKVSQLLSGHVIQGSQLASIPASSVLELTRESGLIQSLASPDDRAWRSMLARSHAAQHDWAGAARVLATLAGEPDTIWESHAAYGHALAELGRWSEAERAFTAALARRPDWTELHYYAALARRAGGDVDAIPTGCAETMRTLGSTRNPDRAHWLAGVCVLADVEDPGRRQQTVELARMAADIEPDSERFVMIHAAALIRAGHPDRAEALLSELLKRIGRTFDQREEKLLVLASAQRALGHVGASGATRAQFEAAPAAAPLPWHRRVEIDLWREFLSRR